MTYKPIFLILNKKTISFLLIMSVLTLCLISYFTSILAFEEKEHFPLQINDVKILGEDLVEKSNFSKNELVLCETNVEKPLNYFLVGDNNQTESAFAETQFRLIITIMDETKRPTFIQIYNSSISLGEETDITLIFSLSSETHSGAHYVSVMVWDELGVPLSEKIGEAIFNVS